MGKAKNKMLLLHHCQSLLKKNPKPMMHLTLDEFKEFELCNMQFQHYKQLN